jgi:hypothetical protein
MNPSPEFHIFRDARRTVRAAELVARLKAELSQLPVRATLDHLLSLLLLAGELECALADADARECDASSVLTQVFADAAVECDSSGKSADGRQLSEQAAKFLNIAYNGTVSVSTPEGFAYYALHPLDCADLIARQHVRGDPVLVIGIRSIGTTLSAVVCAKLRQLGVDAERVTVRPCGNPYERMCAFSPAQCRAISLAHARGAQFVICDEGPGRSGSSLLSVAEALEREGVPASLILMLCSHQPDVDALCTPDAARWARYRSVATGMTCRLPAGAGDYAGGGEWRARLQAPPADWPAVWPQMERLKYFSSDARTLFTFEGHGPYGVPSRERNERLSEAGFGAKYLGHEAGFGKHRLPAGRLARRDDLTTQFLTHMARYCAWRAREFAVTNTDSAQLEEMFVTNLAREFGEVPGDFHLAVERPTICDNRIAPPHWFVQSDGRWCKFDAAVHGDDHFFPGPCDIAWDLAGVVVEWELSSEARDVLLAEYRRWFGDDATSRLCNYELAYAMFRLAWLSMAAPSVVGSDEARRVARDITRYRQLLARLVRRETAVTDPARSLPVSA